MHGKPKINSLTPKPLFYHLLAFATVSIWGVTFVSTKILIDEGLSPMEIFIYRCLIAYIGIVILTHDRLWANSFKDEGLLFIAGISGGSLYFIAENSALGITFASNVSLLICTAPIFTMLLGKVILHIPFHRQMFAGSVIALCGVGCVVLNDSFNLGLNPLGDLLTMTAALLWAVYCIVLKILDNRYSIFFITRKVFFYGLLSAGIILVSHPCRFDLGLLCIPVVYGNLLFLGVLASMICYIMWNNAVKVIGAEKTSNYIYCVPLITILTAVIFLSEPVTAYTIIGTIMIIGGVYLAEK